MAPELGEDGGALLAFGDEVSAQLLDVDLELPHAARGLLCLLLGTGAAHVELPSHLVALPERRLCPCRSLLCPLERRCGVGEGAPEGFGLRHGRRVRGALRVQAAGEVVDVVMMADELLLELRAGTVERAGQLLERGGAARRVLHQRTSGGLPAGTLALERRPHGLGATGGIGRQLLGFEHLGRGLGAQRRHTCPLPGVAPSGRLVETRERLGEQPPCVGQHVVTVAGEVAGGESTPPRFGTVGVGAVQPGAAAAGPANDLLVASLQGARRHRFGHIDTIPKHQYRLLRSIGRLRRHGRPPVRPTLRDVRCPARACCSVDLARKGAPPCTNGKDVPVPTNQEANETVIDVIVEIPAGGRNKYEYDHERHVIRLDRRLATATTYPADYGFVPDTLALDGDPLDALVILDEPTFPGCLVRARILGLFRMQDEAGPDAKLITVLEGDPIRADTKDMTDLPTQLLDEIEHFFSVYKALEPGKGTQTKGFDGREAALDELRESRKRYVPPDSH